MVIVIIIVGYRDKERQAYTKQVLYNSTINMALLENKSYTFLGYRLACLSSYSVHAQKLT